MRVDVARPEDVPAWLELAAEVEALFGPMVGVPAFEGALKRNVEQGSAYCVREGDGPAGAPLMGGMLLSADPPHYRIGWLAVAERRRRRGVGTLLVRHVLGLIDAPAEVGVITFGPDRQDGLPARAFYERLGLRPAEPAPDGPEGGSRQMFRLKIEQD